MKKNNKQLTIYFILFSLFLIGVVYAILQANLQINGTAKITQNTWDVHFDNIVVNPNSVSIGTGDSAATIDPNNNCKVDFEVTLSLPGDFYEFTVDVENEGTINAMIGTLTKTLKVNNVAVEEVPEYLNYTVTYADGEEILENHALNAGTTVTYLVRLEFRTDIDELPEAATLSTSLEPVFVQADPGAIPQRITLNCTYDDSLTQGTEYTNGQYTYRYKQEYGYNSTSGKYEWMNITADGWGVHITDPYATTAVDTILCTTINDKPIVSMNSMFHVSQASSVDMSSFHTEQVTNADNMFSNSQITELDFSGCDFSNLTSATNMFKDAVMLNKITLFKTMPETNLTIGLPATFIDSNQTQYNSFNNSLSAKTELNVYTPCAVLLPGESLNTKLFELSIGGDSAYNHSIYSIQRSDELPEYMTFTDDDLISVPGTGNVYAWFEEISYYNDYYGYYPNEPSGTIFIYSDSPTIYLNSNCRLAFASLTVLLEFNLGNVNTSNVTNMDSMFYDTINMASEFYFNVSDWDTSNVTNMAYMFLQFGYNTTNFELDLSNWNTSNVTNMNSMFWETGNLSSSFQLDISTWDMSNVTDMSSMLSDTGDSSTQWTVKIPSTNGNGINNTTSTIYGKTSSINSTSPSGRTFTIN